ncbi:DUF2567 domain-containing protein [Micromonospora sp. WMMD882]|uniref:DUF2567 domain-containing protein n=1 Tax=Micromonospora sp. WMMD882 TaxID=3015151 RepID=UPI00248B4959|nr:DUF2567 domain-containing protein [Micromonospora sp. WMMD882]WBB80034.1 DUF2567 domain-containing protein [Micromonospora sp. WMMD882]
MSPANSDPDPDRADATSPPPPSAASPWAEPAVPSPPDDPARPGPPVPPGGPVPAGTVRRRAVLAATVTLVLTVLGAGLGLLWVALAPGTPVVRTADGAVYAEPQPEQPIAADGWFSLLGLGFGVLAAIGLWLLLRRHRGPLGLFAVVLGCLGAAVVAWRLGRTIGLSRYERLLTEAPVGVGFDRPVDLRAGGIEVYFGVLPLPYGDLLLPAFAAAVTYTLLAGWSRWPSLRPEPVDLSWAPAAPTAPAAAPEPPAPDAAEPPRG